MFQTGDVQRPGVYAEVRGKYARPPPLMQKTEQLSSFLTPKENLLVSRPSTSGSLKPRSASNRANVQKELKSQENEMSPTKPIRLKYRSMSNKAKCEEPEKNTVQDRVNFQSEEKILENRPKTKDEKENNLNLNAIDENPEGYDIENPEEPPENPENEDNFLRDGLSYVSGLTTSSQRRYIQELEGLLRQEKLKRIQLEESLKKELEKTK